MKAIFRKEMKQYFNSVMGYVFLAIFLLISGFYFSLNNILQLNGDVSSFFNNIITFVMFLLPILTMRSFAEEKKVKTEQLLFTAPVSTTEIVLGKYLAALCMFLIGVAVTLIFPIIIMLFGKLDIWSTLGCYLAFILLAAAFIAVGVFISSLTENQIVSAILTYCVLFALWFVSWVANFVSNTVVISLISATSLFQKYYEMTMGVFNPSTLLFYLSLAGIFLFLTVQGLESRRWN